MIEIGNRGQAPQPQYGNAYGGAWGQMNQLAENGECGKMSGTSRTTFRYFLNNQDMIACDQQVGLRAILSGGPEWCPHMWDAVLALPGTPGLS